MYLLEGPKNIKGSRAHTKTLSYKDRVSGTPLLTKIKDEMTSKIVRFSFRKLDGSTRIAVGTRNLDIIEASGGKAALPKGLRTPSPKVLTFFDLIKREWRCFRRDRLLKMLKVFEVDKKSKKKFGLESLKESNFDDDSDIQRENEVEIFIDGFLIDLEQDVEKALTKYTDELSGLSTQEADYLLSLL